MFCNLISRVLLHASKFSFTENIIISHRIQSTRYLLSLCVSSRRHVKDKSKLYGRTSRCQSSRKLKQSYVTRHRRDSVSVSSELEEETRLHGRWADCRAKFCEYFLGKLANAGAGPGLAENGATHSERGTLEVLVPESSVYSRRGEDKLFVVSNEYLTINNASPGRRMWKRTSLGSSRRNKINESSRSPRFFTIFKSFRHRAQLPRLHQGGGDDWGISPCSSVPNYSHRIFRRKRKKEKEKKYVDARRCKIFKLTSRWNSRLVDYTGCDRGTRNFWNALTFRRFN